MKNRTEPWGFDFDLQEHPPLVAVQVAPAAQEHEEPPPEQVGPESPPEL